MAAWCGFILESVSCPFHAGYLEGQVLVYGSHLKTDSLGSRASLSLTIPNIISLCSDISVCYLLSYYAYLIGLSNVVDFNKTPKN